MVRPLAQLIGRGSTVDRGLTPGPGPFAACHSPSLTLFPVTIFKLYCHYSQKGQKNT